MTGVVLTIPDDPDAVPRWLEQHILGPDHDTLVAELAAVHNPPTTTPILDDVLGSHAPLVLARGLSALPRSALKLLLRNPELLTELRALILIEGGSYWDRYLEAEAAGAARVADRVLRAIAPPTPVRPGRWRWAGYGLTAFATAAAVLIAVYLAGGLRRGGEGPGPERPGTETAAAGWGFQKIDQLPRDSTDAATLTALASLAEEWSKRPTSTPPELLRRLIEFREGCGAIQLAATLPLSAPQTRWLKLRCSDWAAEIDGHIRALEATRDVAAVRSSADRTANRIAEELRNRAARVG